MKECKEMTLEATRDRMDDVIAFVNAELVRYDCPTKYRIAIDVAVEELFVNIASYAYDPGTGPATVRIETTDDPLQVIITFLDHGTPYDPLSQAPEPDLDASIEDRRVGGLGIFMVKNSMDGVHYEYRNGQNILSIRKELQEGAPPPQG